MSIITSYAQNFEDVMLWRALGHIQNGRYIDIGAQDPVVDSVTLAFYEHGWRGVHVEPTPRYAESLRQARPEDIVIQAAVDAKSGILNFYEFPDTGLSTADRKIAGEHIARGFPVKEIVVPCITLDEVFSSVTGEEIHWLKIDVEGGEEQVLEGWINSARRPWIVLIESTYPNTQIETHQQWESLILAKGYTFAYFDGLSRFYIADGHDELAKSFSSGPNIFDVMFRGFGLNGTTPFCTTLNGQLRSLKEQSERELAEAEQRLSMREHELMEQVRACKAEVLEVTQSSAIEHKELSARLQAGEQELKDLLRIQAQREQEVAEQLLTQQQAGTNMQHRFDAQLRAEREVRRQLQHELATMRNSLSWWLTTPLRAVAGWFKSTLTQTGYESSAVEQLVVGPMSATAMAGSQEFTTSHPHDGIMSMTTSDPARVTQLPQISAAQNLKALLQLQDTQFIVSAFQLLLKRSPDAEGFSYYIKRIRAGVPKIQILGQIMDSREAQTLGVEIPGLRKAIRQQRIISLPLVGKVLQIFIGAKSVSLLDEMLKRHNSEFVDYAYFTLLKRAPDPEGFNYYLDRLRAGVPKIQILGQLLDSPEARASGVEFLTLRRTVRRQKLARLPLIGFILKRFIAPEGDSALEIRLRAIEQQLFLLSSTQSLNAIAPAMTAAEPTEPLTQTAALGDSSVRVDGNAIHQVMPTQFVGGSLNYVQMCWHRYHTLRLDSEKSWNQPLLSLCITTYNRAQWLKHSLDNILPQLRGIEHLVEFVICDNASVDETEAVVNQYARRNSCLKYYRNAQNVGMLGNLGVTARHASGKFVWIIGDDDILLEGTLNHILRAIIAFPDIELIYTNYSYTHISDPLAVNLQDLLTTQTLISPETPNRYAHSLKEIAGNTENFFTAIYCCVFRQDHAKACYGQDTSGRPFSSLLTCVPTTNYVLNSMLDCPAFWFGAPAVLVNMNVSWLKYADLWVLERFPEMYEAFEKKGVSSSQINFYRTRSVSGVVHHLRDSVTRKSENLDIIDLRCLFRTYKHLADFNASLPEIFSIIDSDQEFKLHVAFEALESPETQTVVVDGPFVGSYSLAIVNRHIASALEHLGLDIAIGPSPTEGNPFVIASSQVDPKTWSLYQRHNDLRNKAHIALRYTYPPVIDEMNGQLNVYHSFGWEESEFPFEFVEWFNKNLDAVTVMSNYVKRVLEHNGVEIPIINTGLGVDHLNQDSDNQYRHENTRPAKEKFTFLHVSSCFPRKGADILLDAFLKCFDGSDPVKLIIKTFPNIHNDIEDRLVSLKAKYQLPPEIQIINEDWSDQNQLVALYNNCDVLVAPSRGEGFGLPIAEALWLGKPVIATGFGGHMDFLGDDYPWLIDYRFERSQTHFGVADSYWVTPCVNDLIRLLRDAFNTPSAERQKLADLRRDHLEKNFTWRQAGIRLVNAITQIQLAADVRDNAQRVTDIAVVSSWNSRCGIATYVRHLLSEFSREDFMVYANTVSTKERLSEDESNVMRSWQIGDISNLLFQFEGRAHKTLIIQYQPSFFPFEQLAQLVGKAVHQESFVYLFLHNVLDFVKKCAELDVPIFCNRNVRIMVHTINDLNLIKGNAPWALPNTVQFSHGVMDAHEIISNVDKGQKDQFTIATFGFLLPTKGVAELIKAVVLALDEVPSLRLKLYTSLLDERSEHYLDHCQGLIDAAGIGERVEWKTEFLPIDDVIRLLSQADLVVMAYGGTTESSSAAARVALSSGTPLLCTRAQIFDDIAPVVRFVDSNDPATIAREIEYIARNPEHLEKQIEGQTKWVNTYNWQRVSNKLRSMVKGQDFRR